MVWPATKPGVHSQISASNYFTAAFGLFVNAIQITCTFQCKNGQQVRH